MLQSNRAMENKKYFHLRSFMFSLFIFLFSLFLCEPITAQITEIVEFYEAPEIVVYGEASIPLDKDAFVYAFVDTKIMRPIIDIVPVNQLKSRQAAQVIDRTELAVAALFTGDTGRFFQIAGFGSYPNLLINVALAIDRNWKFLFSGNDHYWYSDTDRLSVSLNSEEVYIVQWRRTRMKAMYDEPGVRTPEGFIAFRHRSGEPAPLSLWMQNQNTIIDRMLIGEGITVNLPIERLYLNLYHVEGKVFKTELMLRMGSRFPPENFAISFSPIEKPEQWASIVGQLFNTISPFSSEDLSTNFSPIKKPEPEESSDLESDSVLKKLFFTNQPVINDRSVEFPAVILSEDEIASLLRIFMKYWK